MQRLCLASGPHDSGALVVLPPWIMATSAQTPPRPPAKCRISISERRRRCQSPPIARARRRRNRAAPAAKGSPKLDALKQRDKELQIIRGEQKKARETEAELRREIEQIGDDRRKLNRQLIDVAARVRDVEQQIAASEERLPPLDEKEQALRASLEGRRASDRNVLAALQRIGRNPPPAMLVTPEDALQSVRSAMLLGAVLPEMRQDVEALVADLAALAAVRKEIAAERASSKRAALASLATTGAAHRPDRAAPEAAGRGRKDADRGAPARGATCAAAEDLQELIARLEQELDRTTRAARLAARSGDDKKGDRRPHLAALKDPGRLAPAIAFARAKGMLPLPVNGVRIREYGAADGLGGQEKGLSIVSPAGRADHRAV